MAEVRAKIDAETKRKAETVLRGMNISTASVIRLMFEQIAETGTLPLAPNAETIAAIEAARRGELKAYGTVEEMFADLHADD